MIQKAAESFHVWYIADDQGDAQRVADVNLVYGRMQFYCTLADAEAALMKEPKYIRNFCRIKHAILTPIKMAND